MSATTNMTDEEYRLLTDLKNHYYGAIAIARGKTWDCMFRLRHEDCPYGADMVNCFKWHRVMLNGSK